MFKTQLEKKIKRLEEQVERLTKEKLTLIKMVKKMILLTKE